MLGACSLCYGILLQFRGWWLMWLIFVAVAFPGIFSQPGWQPEAEGAHTRWSETRHQVVHLRWPAHLCPHSQRCSAPTVQPSMGCACMPTCTYTCVIPLGLAPCFFPVDRPHRWRSFWPEAWQTAQIHSLCHGLAVKQFLVRETVEVQVCKPYQGLLTVAVFDWRHCCRPRSVNCTRVWRWQFLVGDTVQVQVHKPYWCLTVAVFDWRHCSSPSP